MDTEPEIGHRRAHLDRDHALGDQFARAAPGDANTQNVLRLRIDDDLGDAGRSV